MTDIEINEKIAALCDTAARDFHKKLIPTQYEILGGRLPKLHKLADNIYKNGGSGALDSFVPNSHEGVMLKGFVMAREKQDIGALLGAVERFLPLVDNWAVCDSVAAAVKLFSRHKELVYNHLQTIKNHDGEFSRRWFIVILMNYFFSDEYIDRALDDICSVRYGQYYVDMAGAWAVSVALVKFYDKAIRLLEKGILPDFVRNKAITKARESFRIEGERKAELLRIRDRSGG